MQGGAWCVDRGRGKPLPYGTVRNNRRGANLRDVEDAVPYGVVRNIGRGA